MNIVLTTAHGKIIHEDSLCYMRNQIADESVDLIFTSPPFALLRKKDYGNVAEDEYLEWFENFAKEFYRVLKPSGSLVIDIGGSWLPGQPTRSLYHFELLIMLCRKVEFHLAQEFYWWNPSKLPTPAEWVNIRRIRVKDAVNSVYWLSKSPWPKASNRRILAPYSDSMLDLIDNGYQAKKRPSGHDISDKFQVNNGGSIPPNLIAIPNTESNSFYLRYCREHKIKPHPARFPAKLPEFFVRMLTDVGDTVLDPFGGSCVTGEVCEQLERNWTCCEVVDEYIEGAKGRFAPQPQTPSKNTTTKETTHYKLHSLSTFWPDGDKAVEPLPVDGGKKRPPKQTKSLEQLSENPKAVPTTSNNHVAENTAQLQLFPVE
ncbi:MAG: site-specific DNA-methyltransferase [Chloroflexota bacterium]